MPKIPAWVYLGAGAVLAFYFWRKFKLASTTASVATTQPTLPSTAALTEADIKALLQLPQLSTASPDFTFTPIPGL